MVSRDADATFEAVDNQPPLPLPFVDHVPAGAAEGGTTLAGADPARRAVAAERGGMGASGAGERHPRGVHPDLDDRLLLAAFAGRVYRSGDGGQTLASGARRGTVDA